MKFSATLLSLGLGALRVMGSPMPVPDGDVESRAAPTLYLCGDSTMAAASGTTDGWGKYISKYVSGLAVVNKAIGGRSARSFTNEGRFQEVANLVKSGDIVVIEFGHNDVGSPRSNDNGRSACPGTGTETCTSDKTGEIVYTYVFYLIQAARLITSKGATVVLSTQTPKNLWNGGTFARDIPRFVPYVQIAQSTLALSTVTYVDHYNAVSKMYLRLGNSGTNALYPSDYTHTSPYGADLSAQAFAQAIAERTNGTTPLVGYMNPNNPKVY